MFVFLSIPLALGIAILRYRLWDIDILIRRTLVYGTLTVILTVVYVGLVIGLQTLLRGIISQNNSVSIVLSTLAMYAFFQPLRRRVQPMIDRRFYRSKYDAAKTVAAFSATLRQEVDLDLLSKQLVSVVGETMQPEQVSLWLVQRESRPPRQVERKLVGLIAIVFGGVVCVIKRQLQNRIRRNLSFVAVSLCSSSKKQSARA
jgi:hypothetical protein